MSEKIKTRNPAEPRYAEEELQDIEWMLTSNQTKREDYTPEYGDLSLLNEEGLILTSAGKEQLIDIVSEYLDLLETSAAIYERNGDYALGLFSSGWCRMMDAASHRLCETDDNREALNSGKWLCHESCWKDASLKSIDEGKPAEVPCSGGINLYAVPVWANGEIVGVINFGFGTPPTDETELEELSRKYQIPVQELKKQAKAYKSRPQFIIDFAKKRIQKAAKYLGYIIERKLAEEMIEQQLAEKETILKEVNHRIKNNIASVESLLLLQSESMDNPEALSALQDAISRVQSMRVLYDKLLIGVDHKVVSVKDYVESLVDSIVESFSGKTEIFVDKQITDFNLVTKRMYNIGIIINELITNTLKYAFKGRESGVIKVSLDKVDDRVTIVVQDNGNGLPEGFDIGESKGFGLMLVTMLVEQMGGRFAMESYNGTQCILEFDT